MTKYKVTNGRLVMGGKAYELGQTLDLNDAEVKRLTKQEIIPHTLEKFVEEKKAEEKKAAPKVPKSE